MTVCLDTGVFLQIFGRKQCGFDYDSRFQIGILKVYLDSKYSPFVFIKNG
jgi:hypothetical protein